MISTLYEKKEIIHIASEIIVIVGIVYYFNQKNKKLLTHIEDLVQRIEDQEDMLQKHEQIIKSLVENLNRMANSQHLNDQQKQSIPNQKSSAPKNKIKQSPKTHTKSPLSAPPKQEKSKVHVSFQKPAPKPIIEEEEYSDGEEIESNSDLDIELAEELGELVSDDDNEDLKKER